MKGLWLLSAVMVGVTQAHASYSVFVAHSQAGSLGGNTSLYGGVFRYDFSLSGGPATVGTGIPAADLSDPAGLKFHNGRLYVSNRHGNTLGQGSVKAFDWIGSTLSVGTTVATSSSASFAGFHGLNFAPDGKMMVSSANGGSRQFTPSGLSFVDSGGTSGYAARDAWVSPNGAVLIETGIGGSVRVSDISGSTFSNYTNFNVPGAAAMHQIAFRNGALYVGGFNSSSVHRIELDANFKPVNSTQLFSSSGAIGLAFSPDGNEMYVSGHTGNILRRYVIGGNGSWIANGQINVGQNLGYIAVIPGPAARIEGTLDLNDVTGTIHGSPMSVQVWNGGSLIETLNVTLGAGGTFRLNPTETSGTRRLVFQTRSGLTKSVMTILQPTPVSGMVVNMTNGDVDLTGEVDAADIDQVIADFGGGPGQTDVDASGEVDAADIDVVIANFGAVGD